MFWLLLTGAGIYAMMSFKVAQRRRGIGIRTALGADALRGFLARAARQIAVGVVAGVVINTAFNIADGGQLLGERRAIIISFVAALSTLGPARRGLAIQLTEALRDE